MLHLLLHKMRELRVAMTIAVSFYIFGFFVIANLLGLSAREIVVGLFAGAIGGVTTLVAVVFELGERRVKPI
jgi:hypothetical protein